jgi:hypothetical protein
MNQTPVTFEPLTYKNKEKACASDIVLPILFGGLGVSAVAVLVWVLFSGRRHRKHHHHVCSSSDKMVQNNLMNQQHIIVPNDQHMIKKEDYDLNTVVDKLAGVTAMEESDGLVDINAAPVTGGIMNQPETTTKKFKAEKMIPKMGERKRGTLADQFAPSGAELAAFLPSVQDMHREQPNGPKFFRTKTAQYTDSGFGPAMIPSNFKELHDNMRTDRPRINEKAMEEQLRAQREYYSTMKTMSEL